MPLYDPCAVVPLAFVFLGCGGANEVFTVNMLNFKAYLFFFLMKEISSMLCPGSSLVGAEPHDYTHANMF